MNSTHSKMVYLCRDQTYFALRREFSAQICPELHSKIKESCADLQNFPDGFFWETLFKAIDDSLRVKFDK